MITLIAPQRTLRAALLGLAGLVAVPGNAATGDVQALVNALASYADNADTTMLRRQLHGSLRGCVDDLEGHVIARFVLTRVRTQGLPDRLATRTVPQPEIRELAEQARALGLRMPVTPRRELRLIYPDHTARLFLANDGGRQRWVLPCR